MIGSWLYGLGQLGLVLSLAPLMQGIIQKVKAIWQRRKGPPIFQPYYDLIKYFRKQSLVAQDASWIFIVTPYVVFAVMLTASLFIPAFWVNAPLRGSGDMILLIGLFALARFFTTLSGLDTGSHFGGMGSSRDLTLAAIAEPALLLALFAVLVPHGTTSLSVASLRWIEGGFAMLNPVYLISLCAFFIILLAELGRVPVDNPDTHLELTMIHEGMLLEYSGRKLGWMLWATYIKQLLLMLIMINLFFPYGMLTAWSGAGSGWALLFLLLKLMVLSVILGCVESLFAKVRLFHVPKLLTTSMLLSVLAIVAQMIF